MKYARTCILLPSERLDILFFDVAALRRLLAGGMPVDQARPKRSPGMCRRPYGTMS